jgi:hypothetical protein
MKDLAFQQSPICPRCGEFVEFLWHRLWDCCANSPLKTKLLEHGIDDEWVAQLPLCLQRAGLIPFGCSLDVDKLRAWLSYLCIVNADAADALGAAQQNRAYVPYFGERCLDISVIYGDGLPSLRRLKTIQLDERDGDTYDPPPLLIAVADNMFPLESPCPVDTQGVISLDGAYYPQDHRCGWGFCVADARHTSMRDFCGPVLIDDASISGRHEHFCLDASSLLFGASVLSNNTAELTAIVMASIWVWESGDPNL